MSDETPEKNVTFPEAVKKLFHQALIPNGYSVNKDGVFQTTLIEEEEGYRIEINAHLFGVPVCVEGIYQNIETGKKYVGILYFSRYERAFDELLIPENILNDSTQNINAIAELLHIFILSCKAKPRAAVRNFFRESLKLHQQPIPFVDHLGWFEPLDGGLEFAPYSEKAIVIPPEKITIWPKKKKKVDFGMAQRVW